MNEIQPFDVPRFEQLVAERKLTLGRHVLHFATTHSTSDVAMRLAAEGAPHGQLVIADHQTRGRGRHGNVWLSPGPCENLLFSVILRLNHVEGAPSNFTLALGLALRDALQPFLDEDVCIKWVNDIMVVDKKLAGILVECQASSGNQSVVVAGIGLNVHMTKLPLPIHSLATSLALLDSQVLDRELLLAEIMQCIENRTAIWETQGIEAMIGELNQCDALRGRHVKVGELKGVAMGIDANGALLLQTDGQLSPLRITSGMVEFAAK
jgi:BirA family biotin operon repressor/biotin-[acetyl-CoA-carboxylase] ligase